MIDPSRTNECIREDGKICSEYPQIEIKLLRFINCINNQAIDHEGHIFKLLGNHELMNILDIFHRDERDVFVSDKIMKNYFRGTSREESFKVGQPGFKLLFQDGCGMLLKINNSIFVHGQLPLLLQDIDNINQFMNNSKNHNIELQNLWIEKLNENYNTKKKGPLQQREWALPFNISNRIKQNKQEKFCIESVRSDLVKFIGNDNVDKLRVILGHCPQNPDVKKNKDNRKRLEVLLSTTMTFKSSSDSVSKTYSSERIRTGLPIWKNQDTIYGITMQCPKPKNGNYTDFFIYQIDTSSSRDFDWKVYYDWITYNDSKAVELENICLFSKTPQVLSIKIDENGEDLVSIIKSKMRNTRIHLPRFNYEELIKIKNIKNLSLDSKNYD